MSDTPTPFDSQPASYSPSMNAPAPLPPRYPRVWTVFAATAIALLVHVGASALISNAAALVALGPAGMKRLAEEEAAFDAEQAKAEAEADDEFSVEDDRPASDSAEPRSNDVAKGEAGADKKPSKKRSPFESWMISFAKTPIGFAIVILPGQLAFLGVTLMFALLSPQPWRERLAIRRPREHWFLWVLFALSTPASALVVTVPLSQFVSAEDSRTLADFQEIFSSGGVVFFVLTVLGVALMPALAEEFLFRGYVQSRLLKAWPAWGAILVSGVLFAVAHMDPIQSLGVLPIGIWMGIVAFRTNSLLPAIGCHLVNNTYALVAMRLSSTFSGQDPENFDMTRWEPWALVVVVLSSMFCFAVSGLYLLATGLLRELSSRPSPLPAPEEEIQPLDPAVPIADSEGVAFLSEVRPYRGQTSEGVEALEAIPVDDAAPGPQEQPAVEERRRDATGPEGR